MKIKYERRDIVYLDNVTESVADLVKEGLCDRCGAWFYWSPTIPVGTHHFPCPCGRVIQLEVTEAAL